MFYGLLFLQTIKVDCLLRAASSFKDAFQIVRLSFELTLRKSVTFGFNKKKGIAEICY